MHRRDILRSAAAAALLGRMTPADAQHVHQQAATSRRAGGAYKPKLFNAHEFKTLQHLADMIIPPENGEPGGAGAGAAEFIDTLASANERLAGIFFGGLAWLDRSMERRAGNKFVDASMEQHSELLDLIAYRKNQSAELGPGIAFFDWCRRMVVDAYFTSPAGIEALGYKGNKGMAVFQVPVEALNYALGRSPFKDQV